MNQTKTAIEDFRDLKPYYDLVFNIMTDLAKKTFDKDLQGMTDALRELIINAPAYAQVYWESEDKDKNEPDKMSPEDLLDLIETEYAKVLNPDFKKPNLSTQAAKDKADAEDDYIIFCRKLRIKIATSFSESGLLPKASEVKIHKVGDKFRKAAG